MRLLDAPHPTGYTRRVAHARLAVEQDGIDHLAQIAIGLLEHGGHTRDVSRRGVAGSEALDQS